MGALGQGIALAALIFSATYLEVHDKQNVGLWAIIAIWIMFTDWRSKT